MKKALKWSGVALLTLVLLGLAGVPLRMNRTFDAPLPALAATSDPQHIARGRYLVYGPGHCVSCHADPAVITEAMRTGKFPDDVALTGGQEVKIPPGTFRIPNLTPDPETGIGGITDGQIARALRYGVRHDGQVLLPFMAAQDLSDDDLVAILSFLRAQKPVKRAVPEHSLTFLGKVVKAYVLAPQGPRGTPPAKIEPGPTAAYGKYLAEAVGNCQGCHTRRSLRTGRYTGEPFAGCSEMGALGKPGFIVTAQNLTPDPETSKIAGWSEDTFLARFRTRSTVEGTHMPWACFSLMTDDDLRAIYRYLQTVKPVHQECPPPLRAKS